MQFFKKFLLRLGTYLLISVFVSAFTLIVSLSAISGRFPPSWAQTTAMVKNIKVLLAAQKGGFLGVNGLSFAENLNKNNLRRLAAPVAGSMEVNGDSTLNGAGLGDDGIANDILAINRFHQNQARIAEMIQGQVETSSLADAQRIGNGSGRSDGSGGSSNDEARGGEFQRKQEERLQRMETLLGRMVDRLNALEQRVNGERRLSE